MTYSFSKLPFLTFGKPITFPEHRRADITTYILLIIFAANLTGAIIVRYFFGKWGTFDLIGLTITFFAVLISRTRYYSIGAFGFIFLSCFLAYFVAKVHTRSGDNLSPWLSWFVLPLLLSPLIFSWRKTIFASIVPSIFMLMFILKEHPANWGGLMSILIIGAFISTAIAYSYERDLQLIFRQNEQLIKAYEETLQGWAKVLEMRDKETHGHSERVTQLAVKIAQAMNIQDKSELQFIRYGSLLHDIGKLVISDSILHKPDILTPKEREIIQQHTEHAYEWLKDVEFLHLALDIPRYHHEKWDGSGYNFGLKGEQIPLSARIFAIADVWDALVNERVYRTAWTHKKAIAYITEQAGKEFDPQVVEKFLEVIQDENLISASESSNPASAYRLTAVSRDKPTETEK
jgi:hypothetical protein